MILLENMRIDNKSVDMRAVKRSREDANRLGIRN